MAWKKYNSRNRSHSVYEYECGDNFIRCSFNSDSGGFKKGKKYQWTAYFLGQEAIDEMKALAKNGSGLSTYIKKNNLSRQVARVY